jgi:formylglycine-generating enzyme required for sulfatase activity
VPYSWSRFSSRMRNLAIVFGLLLTGMSQTVVAGELASGKAAKAKSDRIVLAQVDPDSREAEKTFWDAVKDSGDAEMIEAYLESYPNGRYAADARTKLHEFRRDAQSTETASEDPALAVAPGSGESFRDCPECPEMVVVPAGTFMMGSNEKSEEKPRHRVTIAQPFAVGKYEVTFAEWDACVEDGGCQKRPNASWGRGRQPVMNVNWQDAHEYTAWLSRKTGKTYRLLSEAEWEYAARAGTTSRFAYGNKLTRKQARYRIRPPGQGGEAVEVGTLQPNRWGLYDVHGNLNEWVEDPWHENYRGAPSDGSVWAEGGDNRRRVLRSGCWALGTINLRSSARWAPLAVNAGDGDGLRVARTLEP